MGIMKEEEYYARLKKIELDFKLTKEKLYIDYALSNAIFKKGDIIKWNEFIILIDKITPYRSLGLPMPLYSGPQLKKDLTPRLDGNRMTKYGNDNVTLIRNSEPIF